MHRSSKSLLFSSMDAIEQTDVQFQFVEHGFVHNSVAVNKLLEERIFSMVSRCFSEISMLRVPEALVCMVYII